MLRRNLIYTAITRSKQFLIVCGEEEALRYGVGRSGEEERRTTLLEKLQEGFRDKELISQPENPVTENESSNEDGLTYEQKIFQTDPMIGMENITPYDFMIRG